MSSFDEFRSDIERLAAGTCPLHTNLRDHSGDVVSTIDDPMPLADAAHTEEHPTPRHCSAEIVGRLFSIENRMRGIAWNYAYRPMVGDLLREIRETIGRLEREHDLPVTPHWTLDQVIAGGPGYERRWPGYRHG